MSDEQEVFMTILYINQPSYVLRMRDKRFLNFCVNNNYHNYDQQK